MWLCRFHEEVSWTLHCVCYATCRQELCQVALPGAEALSSQVTACGDRKTSMVLEEVATTPIFGPQIHGVMPAALALTLYKSQQLTAHLYAKPVQQSVVQTAASQLLRRAVASNAITGIGKGFLDTLINGHLSHHLASKGEDAGFGMEPGAVARATALYNRLTTLALWRDQQARAGVLFDVTDWCMCFAACLLSCDVALRRCLRA